MKRIVFLCLLLLPVLLLGEEQKKADAWVSHLNGKTGVIRSSGGDSGRLSLNLPVDEGDRIITNDSVAEVEFGFGNFLRVWKGSDIEFIYLKGEIRVDVDGDAYLQVEDTRKKISVTFSNSISDIRDPGLYRFRNTKRPEIIVFHGELEVEYMKEKRTLKWKEMGILKQDIGTCSIDSQYSGDEFERLNDERAKELESRGEADVEGEKKLAPEVKHHKSVLRKHGRWVDTHQHGWCWVPYERYLVTGWRPYYCGNWRWYSTWGWTWIPYESWGWVTHHYGLWYWDQMYGWYWLPGIHWRGAYVRWWGDGYYLGWSPLGWYEQWCAGGYRDYRGWNFIRKGQLQSRSGGFPRTVITKEQLGRSIRLGPSRVSATGPSVTGRLSFYSAPSSSQMGSAANVGSGVRSFQNGSITPVRESRPIASREKVFPSRNVSNAPAFRQKYSPSQRPAQRSLSRNLANRPEVSRLERGRPGMANRGTATRIYPRSGRGAVSRNYAAPRVSRATVNRGLSYPAVARATSARSVRRR